jgi:hypothetical protein
MNTAQPKIAASHHSAPQDESVNPSEVLVSADHFSHNPLLISRHLRG